MSNHRQEGGGDGTLPITNVIVFTTNTDISSSGYTNGDFYSAEPVAEADITLTIPDSVELGKRIQICLSLPGSVTIATESGEPLDGTSTQIISLPGECITLQDNGAGNGYKPVQDSRVDPSSTALSFYALDDDSGISTYKETALDINDARIHADEQLSNTVAVSTVDMPLVEFITDPGVIDGVVPAGPVNIIARLQITTGSGFANYYVELYHRDNVGSETLLGTSETSGALTSSLESHTVSLQIEDTNVASDEFLVAKYFLNRIPGGSDPSVDIYTEGANALARGIIGVPITSIPHNSLPSKQGGTTGEFYHLTVGAAEVAEALFVDGGYEEAEDWTPGLTADTPGDLNYAFTDPVGKYFRIGKFIKATFSLNVTTYTHSTASGALFITGLPYANRSDVSIGEGGYFTSLDNVPLSGRTSPVPTVEIGATTFRIRAIGDDTTQFIVQVTTILTGQGWAIRGTVYYEAGS